MTPIEYGRSLASGPRLGQFASVGFLGATVDMAVLVAVVEITGVAPVLAKVVAAEAAIFVMFCVNERWTFSQFGRSTFPALTRRFLKSNLVRVGGVSVAVGVLFLLHNGFGMWYVLANVIGIGTGFFVNYTFESLFTWRVHH